MRFSLTLCLLISLGACGDPLAGIEKLEDVELAPAEPLAQALPDEAELEEGAGLLPRLAPADTALDADATASDADLTAKTEAVAAPTGLRGWLRRAAEKSKETEAESIQSIATDSNVTAAETELQADVPASETTEVADASDDTDVEASVEPEKRVGIFARLRAANVAQESTQVAALDSDTSDPLPSPALAIPKPRADVEPKKKRGVFSNAGPQTARNGPDARDVEYGTVLPYGQVARVCGAKGQNLGRKIEKSPTRGRGYTLYDPFPNSTDARTFYLTGFQDGCPRQFTAALALLGTPTLHEQLRYGRPSSEYPYSATDKAYEKVKSSVCRVGKRKPCGSKISELEKTTVFVTTYERFGGNAKWADMLIHDGTVLAASIKKP